MTSFKTYLHKEFRKKVYEARNIMDDYERTAVINRELEKLEEEFENQFPDRSFMDWIQNTNFRIKTKNTAKERVISVYNYAIKYMTTKPNQKNNIFNHDFYYMDAHKKDVFMNGNKKFTQTYFRGADGNDVSILDIEGFTAPSLFESLEESVPMVLLEVEINGNKAFAEIEQDIHEVLTKLKPLQYKVVIGRILEKKTFKEIAEGLGVTESHVAKQYKKAMEKITL
jgi:RNA polymerase sigma factor (sigma-70 family)